MQRWKKGWNSPLYQNIYYIVFGKGGGTVKRKRGKITTTMWLLGFAFLLLLYLSGNPQESSMVNSMSSNMKRGFACDVMTVVQTQWMPLTSFPDKKGQKNLWITEKQMGDLLPFYAYAKGINWDGFNGGEMVEGEEVDEWTAVEETEDAGQDKTQLQKEDSIQPDEILSALLLEENLRMHKKTQAEELAEEPPKIEPLKEEFVPHTMMQQIDLSLLADYETLVKTFYTIDANTMAGKELLSVDKLLEKDMRISKEGEEPKILIYHTHSQEVFADSIPGDSSTGIVGVGEHLTEILTNTYGYQVLHHTGEYDVKRRDDAYSLSLPAIKQVLEENPSIEVVIDLHRDEMPKDKKLVMELDGRPTARFMFFNGLSRTRKTGNISYLYNENLQDNLSFSFQMQLMAAQYYPGLTRKIYLKGYRYNMHLRPKTLLIELGAQNNTVEEAMNACDPLAHILDMVLSGNEA